MILTRELQPPISRIKGNWSAQPAYLSRTERIHKSCGNFAYAPPSLSLGLSLGGRPALVARQSLNFRCILLLHRWILRGRIGAGTHRAGLLGGRTALAARLAGNPRAGILCARRRGNVRLGRLGL